jgi:hypothetical protein
MQLKPTIHGQSCKLAYGISSGRIGQAARSHLQTIDRAAAKLLVHTRRVMLSLTLGSAGNAIHQKIKISFSKIYLSFCFNNKN